MSIKTQIKKLEHYEVTHRSAAVRFWASALAVATVFSLTELGHDRTSRVAVRDVITTPSYINAAENEMERIPIKFDDGLIAQTNGGL